MKGPVKLPVAIALALACGNAFALGLGAIQVKSGLNQPLDAEIPVLADSPAEVNALTVDIASQEDFERIGLSRSRLTVPIEMAVTTNARGQTVIKVTTKEIVREPLIDFLVVANWSKGKLLREFTILLDPPVTAPPSRGAAATVAPVTERPSAPAPQPLAEPKTPPAKAVRPEPKPPTAVAKPAPPPKPVATPKPPPPAPAAPPPKPATGNDYGPVAQGETLSEIARATRPDEKTNIDQMMLALLKANPKSFYQDNINALRRGAILRIPSAEEIRASGSIREAIEQVHSQHESWSGKAPVAPTLVARTGSSSKTEPAPKATKDEAKPAKSERLALVPPSAGKNAASADRAGTAAGTGKDNAEVKAELARTKESLTAREQEASELKSRVKQLEDISSKDQRLISMKDSEIADLQKKLKDLQAKTAASAAAAATKPPVATTAAPPAAPGKPDQKVTAKDIWGDLNAPDKNAAQKNPATPAPGSATSTPATTPPPPATSTAASSPPSTAPASSAATTATSPATTSAPAPTASSPPATTASTPSTPVEPAPATVTPAPPAADTTVAAAKPAASATTPIKTSAPAKITPLEPASQPFYKNQNVLLAGGAALLLVGLLALMRFMRKPKPAFAAGGVSDDAMAGEDEELRLRDALQQNPRNTAASLELLRYYYSRGEAAKFEATAETMHAHLVDAESAEWDEALAMGAVLAPNHPLFSAVAAEPHMGDDVLHEAEVHAHEPAAEFDYAEHVREDEHRHAVDDAHTHIGTFDLDHVAEERAAEDHALMAEPAPAARHDDGFDFDLPVHTPETLPEPVEIHHVEPAAMPVAEEPIVERNDDIYVGEDAIGTKLDLAKAYLDMGDPEGAKSMLDEVLAEGNDSQRDEARRLLTEIK